MIRCAECGSMVNRIWEHSLCEQCMRDSGLDPGKATPVQEFTRSPFESRILEARLREMFEADMTRGDS